MMTINDMTLRMVEMAAAGLGQRLKRIILYGSAARGEYRKESDIDCIVVVDRIDRYTLDTLDDVSAAMLIEYGAVFSLVPVSEDRYRADKFNPLLINAGKEGMQLWPKTA